VCIQIGWSVEGVARIQKHAEVLLLRMFLLQADYYAAAASYASQPVSDMI